MTIAGDASDPFMLVSALESTTGADNWVLAIDLHAEDLEWKVQMPGSFVPAGQYAIVTDGSDDRVVFSGYGSGMRAIGAP
jgi:hypothetical protein